jgi:hypothetical protein
MSALGTTLADCARQLQVQFGWLPGEAREVRVLHGEAKRRRLVHEPEEAAAFAARQPRGAGIYVTMNALQDVTGFAADVDVPRRVRFAVDLDPVRGAGTPATDAQVDAARTLAADVERFLLVNGWPPAVRVDSGNGAHCYWRADLDTSSTLPRELLKALDARFSTAAVGVDRTIHNPARIMRAAGCWNCKGIATDSAPHRVACVTAEGDAGAPALVAEDFVAVLRVLGVAGVTAGPAARLHGVASAGTRLDVDAWLAGHGMVHRGPREWRCQDGAGTRWVLAVCPFNPTHDRGEACVMQSASGAVAFRCQHHSCAMHGWRELREFKDGPRRGALDVFMDSAGRSLRGAQGVRRGR